MEESTACSNSMDILQSYLERDPCLLTDLQLSSSSDSCDITSEEEEDFGNDDQRQTTFAEVSQKLLDELEMLEAEFQNKAILLKEEGAEGVQVSKVDNTQVKLSEPSVLTLNHLPEHKPLTRLNHPLKDQQINYLREDPPLHHLPEDQPQNHLLKDQPLIGILEGRQVNNILEDKPLSDILKGSSQNDSLEDRPPQPKQVQVACEPSTKRKEEDHQPKDLEETVSRLLEEKKQNTEEIGEQKCQIQKLKEEVKEERLERKSLALKLERNQRKFLKLNRVSLAVTHEYAEMIGQLELEQDLRLEAEIIAHQMLREKREVSRQSMILLQNLEPDQMLLKALEDVRKLEETKAELQTQVKSLELQLEERPSQEEFIGMKEELNTANQEKHNLEEQLKVEQEKFVDLQEKVKTLEEKLKESSANGQEDVEKVAEPILPPPPPPPPPMRLLSTAPKDPLALLREQRGLRPPAAAIMTVSPDVREKAIQEMKKRIEQGNILRPTPKSGQKGSAVNKRKSVISELQGVLLSTAKQPLRRMSRRRISHKAKAKDNELSCLLKKRRQIVDSHPPTNKTAEIPKQTQECTAETKRQTQDEGGSQAPEAASSFQNSPVFLKMKQRASPVQSRRSSQVQWQ